MAIRFDYNQTIGQAKLLDELANDMGNQCAKKLGEVYENINAAWTGEAAKAYLRYVQGVRDDMAAKAKYLRDTAEFLRMAAKKMKEADQIAQQATRQI